MKELLYVIKNQLLILGFVLIFKILVCFNILPEEKYLINIINNFFKDYGLFAVLFSSFLENLIGFGSYFPGSIVILTSMAMTYGNIKLAILTYFVITISSLFSHLINFIIGSKISNYNKSSINNITKHLFLTLWHPHFAAVSSFTLGSMQISYLEFFKRFIPIHIFWNSFWAIFMYSAGALGQASFSFLNLFYAYIIIWIIWDITKFYNGKNKKE